MSTPNYHTAKAYPECPYIEQTMYEVDFFTKQRWRPADEPFLLALPCHHMFQRSYWALPTLTQTWKCPICHSHIQDVVEYPSAQAIIHALKHGLQYFLKHHHQTEIIPAMKQMGYFIHHPVTVPNPNPPIQHNEGYGRVNPTLVNQGFQDLGPSLFERQILPRT